MDRLALKQKKIESLASKHKQFENLLNKATSSLGIDDLAVNELKKKKLRIRDQLFRLKKLNY